MRVLTIGNFGTSWDSSICDEEHIAKALEDLGHEVVREQRGQFGTIDEPDYYENIDFVLIAQYDGYSSNIIRIAKKYTYEAPVVYWAFDYQADGQEWHERLVKEADLYLSKRIADSKYPNWQWLSQDFAPQFLTSVARTRDIDVLFTGSWLSWATERNETLAAINDKFNLVIHSVNEWPDVFKDVRPPIMDEGLPELYARAKVILSIDHTLEAGYWSDRNAQIICCGYRPLFRYIPLSEARFNDDVDYFYNIEDCLQKIEQQLKSPNTLRIGIEDKYRVSSKVKDLLTIVESIL